MQKKKRPQAGKLAPNLQRHASELAAAEARRIPWQLLWEARNQYLEWQEFYHWLWVPELPIPYPAFENWRRDADCYVDLAD